MSRMNVFLTSSITKDDQWLQGENSIMLIGTIVILLVALYISIRIARKHKLYEEDLTTNTN